MDSRDEILHALERIEASVTTESEKGIKQVVKKQTEDVQGVIKEELIKSLFATSLADGIRELLRLALEMIALFFVAHIALSVVTTSIIVAIIGVVIYIMRRKKNHA